MLKKVVASFLLALHNIRSHFFHTILSILGIVIGVAALVAILSLIDGLEMFAKEQIRKTSSLNAIMVYSEPFKMVNNVRLRKDSVAVISYQQFDSLKNKITRPVNFYISNSRGVEIGLIGDTSSVGTILKGIGVGIFPDAKAGAGRLFNENDLKTRAPYIILNTAFAATIKREPSSLIGKSILYNSDTLEVLGVLVDTVTKSPGAYFPITRLSAAEFKASLPSIALEASSVEDVNPIKEEVLAWIKTTFPKNTKDFHVVTNDFRIQQAAQGFLLFRIVMGLIVGISVLVGGIGVMNVLLISVTQRTVEIGIRKAVGANKRDIILQFLSESIAVSTFGSLLGLILGILSTMAVIPLIRMWVDVPFQAEYTWNTFLLISIIAVVIGIVFGTYPALRASRLDPVEAIRRE